MLRLLVALALAGCAPAQTPGPPAVQVQSVSVAPAVTLHVETFGDGPNVVLIPGALFLSEQLRGGLASEDRTLVFYDMRNRGASSRVEDEATINILADVADLEAVRAHIGAEQIALVGYSYLGLMTALYAAEHAGRVSRLVQIGPVPRQWDTPYPREFVATEESLSAEGRAAAAAWDVAAAEANAESDQLALCALQTEAMSFYLVGDPANASRVANVCRYENERPAALGRHFAAHFADIQTRAFPAEPFRALTIPTLIVHGTLDRNAPYGAGREWAQTIPDARLVTVEGGAHNVWLDDPHVIDDISAFLDGAWPERAEHIAAS
ncbi:MAG: alpha/beta fold hydrolase [Hyphomonadaceae bacterium]